MDISDIDLDTLDMPLEDYYKQNSFKIEIDDYLDFSPESNSNQYLVQQTSSEESAINPDEFLNYAELNKYSPKQFDTSPTLTLTSSSTSPNSNYIFESPPVSPPLKQPTSHLVQAIPNNVLVQQFLPLIPVQTQLIKLVNGEPKKTVLITKQNPKPIAAKKRIDSSSDSDSSVKTKTSILSVDPKILKRQERMIKNRESANLSRTKKKNYLISLEKENQNLKKENHTLKTENFILKEKLNRYNKFTCKCASSISQHIPKNAVFLLAIFFMVSINIGSLGNLVLKNQNSIPNQIPQKSNEFYKRNLLFVNETEKVENFSTTNSHENENLQGCQTAQEFLNQTEKIASDLRQWIRQADFNNASKNYENLEEFNAFFTPLSKKLLSIYENSKDTYWKNIKKKHKKNSKKERSEGNRIQLYNPNNKNVKYSEFFDLIGKRSDVFYVFNFGSDPFLLPATFYNKSNRPKLNFFFPTFSDNNGTIQNSEFMQLMQIDCEILNTKLIKVKENLIPENFISSNRKSKPSTTNTTDTFHSNLMRKRKTSENGLLTNVKLFKPFFGKELKSNFLNSSNGLI